MDILRWFLVIMAILVFFVYILEDYNISSYNLQGSILQ